MFHVFIKVRAVRLLIRQSHVMSNEVAVLSQYRAQCSLIEKELLKKGEKDVTVSTVVSAQGNFQARYCLIADFQLLLFCVFCTIFSHKILLLLDHLNIHVALHTC